MKNILLFAFTFIFAMSLSAGYTKYKEQYKKVSYCESGCNVGWADGASTLFSVPAGCIVSEVKSKLSVVFAGSSVETVGDADDADGWILDGFGATTALVNSSLVDLSGDYITFGATQNYAKDAAVDILITVDSTPTAGAGDFFIFFRCF